MSGFESLLRAAQDLVAGLSGDHGQGTGVLFLAMIFGWTGIAKSRNPRAAAMAMVDLGFGRRVRPHLGRLLAAAEIGLAASLAVGTAFLPALSQLCLVAAAVLLWLFTSVVAHGARSEEQVSCFCFGESEDVISGFTVFRTAALASLATYLAVAHPSSTPPIGQFTEQTVIAGSLLGSLALGSYGLRLLAAGKSLFEPDTTADRMVEA